MDRVRHLETLTGHGRIWHNGEIVVSPVRYWIDCSQTVHELQSLGGPRTELPGLGQIEGRLISPVPFSLYGADIELELQDGRRWKCFIQGTNNRLVNRDGNGIAPS